MTVEAITTMIGIATAVVMTGVTGVMIDAMTGVVDMTAAADMIAVNINAVAIMIIGTIVVTRAAD